MQKNLQQLDAAIKNNCHIFLLHSDEANKPLLNLILQRLYNTLACTARYQFFADRYFKHNEVQQIVANNSLFAEKTAIEINYKSKPNNAQEEEIALLSDQQYPDIYIILTCDKLTSLNSSWIKKIVNSGFVWGITDKDLAPIVSDLLFQHDLTIADDALELLLELNHGNAVELIQEINRFCYLFAAHYHIKITDIGNNNNIQHNIYQLSNAYLRKNLSKSLEIVDKLFMTDADAILIGWIINEDVKKMLRLKAKSLKGVNLRQAASELKLWMSPQLIEAANHLSYSTLLQIKQDLAALDMVIKGAATGNVKSELHKILTSLTKQ